MAGLVARELVVLLPKLLYLTSELRQLTSHLLMRLVVLMRIHLSPTYLFNLCTICNFLQNTLNLSFKFVNVRNLVLFNFVEQIAQQMVFITGCQLV